MLALPDICAAPRAYTTAQSNPLAAEMALALAGDGEIPAPRAKRGALELDVLRGQLADWRDRRLAGMKFIRPSLHLALNQSPSEWTGLEDAASAYTLFVGNANEDFFSAVWRLERRWRALQAVAPGLAPAALNAIEHAARHSFPVYTPGTALCWASMNWWMGEEDERDVLAEYRSEEGEDAPAPDDMPTRAWLDKLLPPMVTMPRSSLERSGLERLARRQSDAGEIARLVLAIQAACSAAHRREKQERRRRKNRIEFASQDEGGFTALGFAAALCWNARDPMFRIFDDCANSKADGEGCNESYGWFVGTGGHRLPEILAELDHCFAIARLIDRLLPLIATRTA